MKLFVTGGSGFVGSYYTKMAEGAGYDVTILSRRPSTNKRVVTCDMDKLETDHFVEDGKPKYDAVVHLAAHTANRPYDTLENCLYWNVTAPLRLFQAAFEAGIERFIVAGSYFEYGLSGNFYSLIPPHAALLPTESYPASKAAASIAFISWSLDKNVKLSIHRISQVYGDGELPTRFWPALRQAAKSGLDMDMTSGDQIRDFVHVEDVAADLLDTLAHEVDYRHPQIENIGSGRPQTLKQFAKYWWKEWNASGNLNFGSITSRKNEILRCVPLVGERYII